MKGARPTPSWAVEALEPMVLVTLALAGPRAAALLAGLLTPLEAAASTLRVTVDGRATSELHARWLRAFRSARGQAPGVAVIPGRLGALVRTRLAFGRPVLE